MLTRRERVPGVLVDAVRAAVELRCADTDELSKVGFDPRLVELRARRGVERGESAGERGGDGVDVQADQDVDISPTAIADRTYDWQ